MSNDPGYALLWLAASYIDSILEAIKWVPSWALFHLLGRQLKWLHMQDFKSLHVSCYFHALHQYLTFRSPCYWNGTLQGLRSHSLTLSTKFYWLNIKPTSLRRRSHYGNNGSASDVMFCCSHFTFCTVSVTVSLPCHEHLLGNGCHGDVHGGGSWRFYFGCVWAKKRVMVSKGKKPRVKWDSEVERKLIDIWADIIEEFDSELITKKKEVIATTWLNFYVYHELNRAEQYTEKEICNKIDTIMKNEKSMYINYQKRGDRQGLQPRRCRSWHGSSRGCLAKLKAFFERLKDHPALGPGLAEDSAVTPSSIVAA